MPLFHSNAVLVGWAVSLACRGSMVLRRKFSASQFLPDVRRYGATYANYVGKPLSYVLATPERPDDADNPLRAVYGNEGAPADVDRFAHRFDTLVVDGFGSTEGGVAIGRTPDTPPGALGPLPEGTEIVDVDTGEPCPPGVTGEIVNAAGAGRFEGYYNDPDADAERMRGGVYHSGDLGYRDENGYVYFAGRLGDWMRVDGENLGAAPIERVLLRHPDVIEVAVYGIPAPDVGDQVMAALLLTDGADFDVDAFREFLAEQTDLGPKQWPAFVRIAAELPRTESFKVIKRQLAAEGIDCAKTWSGRFGGNLGEVGYRDFPPPPHLRELVECAWVVDGPPEPVRVLPDGCMDLIRMSDRVVVAGPDTTAFVSSAGARGLRGLAVSAGSPTPAARRSGKRAAQRSRPAGRHRCRMRSGRLASRAGYCARLR